MLQTFLHAFYVKHIHETKSRKSEGQERCIEARPLLVFCETQLLPQPSAGAADGGTVSGYFCLPYTSKREAFKLPL